MPWIACKLKPSKADVGALGSQFQEAWNRDFEANSHKPLVLMSLINTFPSIPAGLPVSKYMGVSAFSVYPYSPGHVQIITGTGINDSVNFATRFFSDAQGVDIKDCAWAYKKQREIVRRMDNYRGKVAATHPPFAISSQAACGERAGCNGEMIEDISYTPEYGLVIENWLRQNVSTAWHSLGMFEIAPLDQIGVVDVDLNVHGVKNLKIISLSIPPSNVAANTNNTAMAIGEKGEDLCIRELVVASR
ncbi:GMC oxidoreductase-domain-containing protein [Xylariaceae sp. FL1019]|nr:GMC oxidoreductase-domain-containing protein [Xylariaceae sp. FL1019]